MPLAAWLLTLATPLVARILLALGFSVVTITGFDLTVEALKQQFAASANSMAEDVLDLFLLAGGGRCVGIIFGAISVRITIWMIQRATKIVGSSA